MTSGCSQVSQRSTRRRLRVEQKALRHSVRGAVRLSMRRVLGMHRSSTTSALEPSASVISLCQGSSFGHAQSCTGCLVSPQFVGSRNRIGEPRHDHPHELGSRIQIRGLVSSKRGLRAMPMPRRCQMRRLTFADAQDRSCDGFRMLAPLCELAARAKGRWAGVRKPPGKETAGVGHPYQRALWRFRVRRPHSGARQGKRWR
jgi:hypothetical protein